MEKELKQTCPLTERMNELAQEGFRMIAHPGGRGNAPLCDAAEIKYRHAEIAKALQKKENVIVHVPFMKGGSDQIVVLDVEASFMLKDAPHGNPNGLIFDPKPLVGAWVHRFARGRYRFGRDRYMFGRYLSTSTDPLGSANRLVAIDGERWGQIRNMLKSNKFYSWLIHESIGKQLEEVA